MAIWRARDDIIAKGYRPKNQRLWRGALDAIDDGVTLMLQSECARLQNEMLAFTRGGRPEAMPFNGSLAAMIDRYLSDPDSPFQELRYQSRRSYEYHLVRWQKLEGGRQLGSITFRDLKNWHAALRWPEGPQGPEHTKTAHAMMTFLRLAFKFGMVSELYAPGTVDHCARISGILSAMRFENARARNEELTREMVVSVMETAHAQGRPSIALAQAIQFELGVRQKDVIGEWVPMGEPGISEYQRRGKKWMIGMRWEEIDSDLILRHYMSKSKRGRLSIGRDQGKLMEYDLKLYPLVKAELDRIPPERRTGALVIFERTSLPYVIFQFTVAWRAIADLAGIPRTVRNMDSRAGAATETIAASGGNLEQARRALGHSDQKTTQRYVRGGTKATAEVAVLRANMKRERP